MPGAVDLEIKRAFDHAQRILLTAHIRPDGDAISAVLALTTALKTTGKEVVAVLRDGVAEIFQYLPGWETIKRVAKGAFDLVVVMDCSDLERIGEVLGERTTDINIDHHVTNLHFGKVNLVEPYAVATCAVLAEHMPNWGFAIDQTIAELLLNGILTDTIGFRTANMTPNALRLAADLMDRGANLPELYSKALTQRPFEAVRYWGYGLKNLKREDRLIWTTLSMEERGEAKYPGTDDADLNNILSNVNDCDVSVLFIEQKHKKIKVSWRAQNGYDVSQLAVSFGGGGHKAAAGAEVQGEMEDVVEKIIQATKKLLQNEERRD
jgi:phosphoesterase RecJ-like protein